MKPDWFRSFMMKMTLSAAGLALAAGCAGDTSRRLDTTGHLWMALPLNNQLMAVNTTTGGRHSVFRARTPAQQERATEVRRRLETGEPRLELFTPVLWEPMPGLITGVILRPGGGPAYLTSLGDALVRLPSTDEPTPDARP